MSLAIFYHFVLVFLRRVLTFPAWWYTQGALLLLVNLYKSQLIQIKNSAIALWIKNLFTPMFNDYTFMGKVLSFFFRVFIIFGKLISILFFIAVRVSIFVLYLIVPLFVVYALTLNFQ